MEIHKPKPWHGARELLKEIGIIVIGVLIALGAEQAVRSLHERGEIREAREALHAELVSDASILRTSMLEDQCQLSGLDRSARALRGLGPGVSQPAPGFYGYPRSTVWETVRGGAVTRMTLKEKLAYANFYNDVDTMRSTAERQLNLMYSLRGYLETGRTTPAETRLVLQDIGRAKTLILGKLQGDRDMLAEAMSLGVRPIPLSSAQREVLEAECRVFGAPLGASD